MLDTHLAKTQPVITITGYWFTPWNQGKVGEPVHQKTLKSNGNEDITCVKKKNAGEALKYDEKIESIPLCQMQWYFRPKLGCASCMTYRRVKILALHSKKTSII